MGVIATNLSVAPSFHRQVIVVFFYASGVFAACVRAAGRATSCYVMRSVLRNITVELVSLSVDVNRKVLTDFCCFYCGVFGLITTRYLNVCCNSSVKHSHLHILQMLS